MADDGFSVEVNTASFEAAMQKLKAAVRDGFVHPSFGTLSVQGRLLAKQVQDLTPPKNQGQGNAAIARDLTRIYRPLDQSTFQDKRLKKIIRTDNRTGWIAASRGMGDSHGLSNTIAISFTPQRHTQNRISRGRAGGLANGKRGAKDNLGVVTLGAEGRKARAYMKLVMKRVGWAKAGWNTGLIALGGKVKQGWIARHGSGNGGFEDGRGAREPYIRVSNRTDWGGMDGERILRKAIEYRINQMIRYSERMSKLAAVAVTNGTAFHPPSANDD